MEFLYDCLTPEKSIIAYKKTIMSLIPIKNKYLLFLVNEVLLSTVFIFILLSWLYKLWVTHDVKELAKVDNITVIADKEVNADSLLVADIIMRTDSLLLAKGFEITKNVRVLIVKDRESYRKRTLHFRSQALGVYLPTASTMVMMLPDFETCTLPASEAGFYDRPIESVLAHELYHCYMFANSKWLRVWYNNIFNKWKTEGFADYVAESSSFNVEQGKRIFIENGNEHANLIADKGVWGHTYFYFLSRLRTEYLIKHKGLTYGKFWAADYDDESLALLDG